MLAIDLPKPSAYFGLVCEGDRVTDAAPIAKYAVGWPVQRAIDYFASRGATVEFVDG